VIPALSVTLAAALWVGAPPPGFHRLAEATERRYGAGMAIPLLQAKARFPYPAGIRYTNGEGSTNGRTSRRTTPLD
jgi:hypothetical protein